MTEETVSRETAKLAKEKGYDEIVDWFYNENYKLKTLYPNINGLKHSDGNNGLLSAPSQSLLQKWLREVHKIHIVIGLDENGYALTLEEDCDDLEDREVTKFKYYSVYNTYELALESGLQEALKLIK